MLCCISDSDHSSCSNLDEEGEQGCSYNIDVLLSELLDNNLCIASPGTEGNLTSEWMRRRGRLRWRMRGKSQMRRQGLSLGKHVSPYLHNIDMISCDQPGWTCY